MKRNSKNMQIFWKTFSNKNCIVYFYVRVNQMIRNPLYLILLEVCQKLCDAILSYAKLYLDNPLN